MKKRTFNEIRVDAMDRHYAKATKMENKLIEIGVPEDTIDNLLNFFDLGLIFRLRWLDAIELINAVGELPPSICGFLYTLISVLMIPFTTSLFNPIYVFSMHLNMKCMVAVEIWYNKEIVMPIVKNRQQIQLFKR